ncbi:MAG: hypothetical protein J6W00_01645 [Lentisphaeria bacterium]|nr:hypothetical protein [Lentisphaeria bacterium]
MPNKFTMEMSICQAENGFSLDEFVKKLAAAFAIDKLIGYFDGCGYNTAATYLRRAKTGMFGYIRRWLKWGLISPRASSMVERVMRELVRRLKKTAYGWSDKGATKIVRIILKRFTNV